jgi:uncharacterized membrane protein
VVLVAIIVGALAGMALGNGFGGWVGAVLGWLILRSVRQQSAIAALQSGLPSAPAREPPARAPEPPPAEPIAVRPAEPIGRRPAEPMPPPIAPEPAREKPVFEPVPSRAAPAAEPVFPPPETPVQPALDWLEPVRRWVFGGNTIVKVGVAILFIGLAFLAKFASEHVRIPIELRLTLIALAAIALLVFGWRLRHRRRGYAEVLQGGAVGVLYLTLFAAFKLYGVLAVGPVFVLMVAVAALSAALAVLQNARALAVVGALGGFATPLLVSTGQGNYVALFTYYLVLDLGIAAVAWYRTWRALNLIGFTATFLVATGWGVLQYRPEHYPASQGFLIAFFLLFVAIMLMPIRVGAPEGQTNRADRWVTGSLLFGLPTVTFALQYGLVREMDYGVALSALVLAGFYVGLAWWARRRSELAVAFEAALAIATVFLTLVIPFALDARSTSGAWALEGAGLVWLGFRQARRLPRAFGYALLLMAGFAMVRAWDIYPPPETAASATFLNCLLAGAASIAAAAFVARARLQPVDTIEAWAEAWLIGWGTLWLLAAAVIEVDAVVPNRYILASLLGSVSAIALVFSLLQRRLRWPRIGIPAMGHAPVHGLGLLIAAATLDRPLQDGGWLAWPVFVGVHLVVLRLVAPDRRPLARDAVHALGALIVAALGALEGRAVTATWGDPASAWAWLGWMVVPAALLYWLERPRTAERWPVSAAPAAYRAGAGAILTLSLVFWTVVANARSNGSAAPLPHLPLVNPLDLGVAAALFAAWRWLASDPIREGRTPLRIVTVVAGFVWINAILLRAFHHYGGVPYEIDAWSASLPVQTGITLLWTVTALAVMWLSARHTARFAWMGGAGLLGLVVTKLMLVDLSGSGNVLRIVSFVGVGVLMLIIGYVAPLPPKERSHAAE